MNIMFDDSITDDIKSKYTVLQLDTFYFADIDTQRVAYCLVETVPIAEMTGMDQRTDLHNNLMRNYRLKNWNYCVNAIEHLRGCWNGELDSFYDSVLDRISELRDKELTDEWNGIIVRA